MSYFIDEIKILVVAGKGGNGCVSFRREKFIPRGGPDGGNGGKGGDVILKVKQNLHALSHLKGKYKYYAKKGKNGSSNNKTGADGENTFIEVPVGTIVKDIETEEILADFTKAGEDFIIARGGRGGRGNSTFKTSTNQAPRIAYDGQEGQEKNILLELKIIADVGLVGYPNAGKSTLISKISNAHPEIAPYPFTTLIPYLGVVRVDAYSSFVMADIPGIIEGAHEGKGLGLRFLKHIERTKVLLFIIDIFDEDPCQSYKTLRNELKLYNKDLLEKPFIVTLNKIDSLIEDQVDNILKSFLKKSRLSKKKVLTISALKKTNLEELKESLHEIMKYTGTN